MGSRVRVRLLMDDVTGKVEVEVGIRSNKRRGLWATRRVDADSSRLEYDLSRAASECALLQIVQYRDAHDPDECARMAREGLRDIQSQASRAHRRIISTGS